MLWEVGRKWEIHAVGSWEEVAMHQTINKSNKQIQCSSLLGEQSKPTIKWRRAMTMMMRDGERERERKGGRKGERDCG